MNQDPIVEEIYQTRQKLLEACSGDLGQLLDRLKTEELQDRDRVVPLKSFLETHKRPSDI
ncbi:MAG: hypothetical protein ETSY1_45580 [Candidatus Entotheonella factor]|uniref:Uncharacterized protein n=1 Tax=Entotheonella factor TaxID=1429438 RepID=W4L2Y3_ENTF1|nr:MAG: hypothetical protein ETSY1_45580 [Candidatus Entotheonella factor]